MGDVKGTDSVVSNLQDLCGQLNDLQNFLSNIRSRILL